MRYLDAITANLHVASGDAENERRGEPFASTPLASAGGNGQFKLAHRALHAEQQPIIGMARFPSSSTMSVPTSPQNSMSMPVTTIAGETRRLDRKHGADTAVADRREQPIEARTSGAVARAAEVIIDDIDIAPAKLLDAIDEAVLAPPALMIARELVCSRLADVDAGAAGEMLSS